MNTEENYVEVVDLDKMSHAVKIKIACDYLKDGRDIVTAKQIDDFIKKNIEGKDELIIDMSNVNGISTKFANFLISLHKQLKGKADITIEGVKGNKRLADLFDVFGLNSLFVIESKSAYKYTKKQITEAIAYWKKQLKMMNESDNYDELYRLLDKSKKDPYEFDVYVNLSHINYIDGGTTTDIAPKNAVVKADLRKNILKQINEWFDNNVGVLPISFKMTIDIKHKFYNEIIQLD